jgi:hypothetical protein
MKDLHSSVVAYRGYLLAALGFTLWIAFRPTVSADERLSAIP